MFIPWLHFIALLVCAGLCGGCLVQPQQRTATIVLPRSTHPQLSYSIDLQAALNEAINTASLPRGSLYTTILSVDESDAHITVYGVASAMQLTMKVQAEYRLPDGSIWWQGEGAGSVLAHKPAFQQLYAAFFAHARRKLCYAVVQNLNTQIHNR